MLKKVLFAVLAVVLFGGSALAFAWWDNLSDTSGTITIGVGEGVTIQASTADVLNPAEKLVPEGVILKTGDVTSVVFEFEVELTQDTDLLAALDLDVTITGLLVGGVDTYNQYIDIDIVVAPETIFNAPVTVTITVTLDMDSETPTAAVEAVQNQDITFNVTFTASEQE